MINIADQFETGLERRPAVAWRWWILVFVVSILVLFLSSLFLLSEDASAKPGGKSLGGAVGGGGGDHDGDRKGSDGAGGGGGHNGDGDRSPVGEAVDAVSGGAQRGEQALKDFSGSAGGADRAVGKGTELASEVAGPVTNKNLNEANRIVEPVTDRSAEIVRPVLKGSGSLVEPVKDVAEPVVKTAGGTVEPIGPAVSPLVEPVAETTMSLVKPVKEIAAPVIEPVGEIAGPVAEPVKEVVAPAVVAPAVVDPLGEIAGPLASPAGEMTPPPLAAPVDKGIAAPAAEPGLSASLDSPSGVGQLVEAVAPAATMQMYEPASTALLPSEEPYGAVSYESAVLQSELAGAVQGSLEVSSDASAGGFTRSEEEASSPRAAEAPVVSKALESGFLSTLQSEGVVSSVRDVPPIQIPQPLGAAGAAAAAVGSLTGGSSSDGGSSLGILALMLVSLLGGKSLWSALEYLKLSTSLIPIIERPG